MPLQVQRLAYRMETEGVWDQTAYNEEQFYPWHDGHAAAGVSSRVRPRALPASPHLQMATACSVWIRRVCSPRVHALSAATASNLRRWLGR